MRRFAQILILLLALTTVAPAPLSACPSCKEAVAAQAPESARKLSRGYSWSIMLMIAMPMTLFGTGAVFVVRAARKGLLPEL